MSSEIATAKTEVRVAVWESGRKFCGRFDSQHRVYEAPDIYRLIDDLKFAADAFYRNGLDGREIELVLVPNESKGVGA